MASVAGRLEFPHHGLSDGDEVDLGGLTLRALATPGHTPEHLSYLLLDGSRPVALFSGGSLLVGAVARTDLVAPERTEPLARALWRSLHDQILTLPDSVAVYPTHGAGSFCSAPAGSERTTTIGREKAANPLLAAPDEDSFVRALLDGLGSYPPYFLRLREVNRHGPALFGAAPPVLPRLGVGEVRRLVAGGGLLIDVRSMADFAAGHVPGSLSISLREQFATWLGWLVDPGRPLLFLLAGGQERAEVVRQALKVGYERLTGELDGGITAWQAAGWPPPSSRSSRPPRRPWTGGRCSMCGSAPSGRPGTSPARHTASSARWPGPGRRAGGRGYGRTCHRHVRARGTRHDRGEPAQRRLA